MNYTEQICKMLKVEPNQPFRIKRESGYWYRINNDCESEWDCGTSQVKWETDRVVLMQILRGDLEIERPVRMTIEQIERKLGHLVEIVK